MGATPVFAEIDPESQNITAESVEAVLTPRTRAVVAVHLAGWPCERDEIVGLARMHDLTIIEDCAQAHGAVYRDRPVGSLGHCAAWSFCQDKIMSTGGEGGMFTTNNRGIWERVRSYKDHGRGYASVYGRKHTPGFRRYIESFGGNRRMTEMQAAIGRVQLRKLPEWTAARRRNAAILAERLTAYPGLTMPLPPAHVEHAWYKFYVFVRRERLRPGWDRDRIMTETDRHEVPGSVGVCPEIYREKTFVDAGVVPPSRLPVARELGETSLMLPVHPTLQPEHMHFIADVVLEVLGEATR